MSKMTEAFELVAMGHVVQENIIFPDRQSELVLGSPAAYSSVAAARLGCRVGLVTRIGPDMPPHLLEPFHQAAVDLGGLHVTEGGATTTSRLTYDAAGHKIIQYLARAAPLTVQDIPEAYQSARLFYICTMDHDVQPDAIREIAALGRPMAIDLGGYGGAHSPPTERPSGIPDELPGLVKHCCIVKASDEDCRRIAADPAAVDEELGRQILDWGASIFVATRGPRGALVLTKRDRFEIPPYQGEVVDPTGGGDTYMAGFLVAYLRTRDPQYAGCYGAATALIVIEASGGVRAERMPTDEAVRCCMERPAAAAAVSALT